jgi:hypothetical protein
MNAISIEAAFRDWWEESYKRPPAPHAVMTHACCLYGAYAPVSGAV